MLRSPNFALNLRSLPRSSSPISIFVNLPSFLSLSKKPLNLYAGVAHSPKNGTCTAPSLSDLLMSRKSSETTPTFFPRPAHSGHAPRGSLNDHRHGKVFDRVGVGLRVLGQKVADERIAGAWPPSPTCRTRSTISPSWILR